MALLLFFFLYAVVSCTRTPMPVSHTRCYTCTIIIVVHVWASCVVEHCGGKGGAVNCSLIIVMDSGVARALYLPDTRLVVPVVLLAPPLVHHHRCHGINIYRVDFWRKTIACDAKKKKTPEPKSSSNPRDILSWRVYKGRLPYNTPILIHITIRNFVWCFFPSLPRRIHILNFQLQ